jgi:hypothetical protein
MPCYAYKRGYTRETCVGVEGRQPRGAVSHVKQLTMAKWQEGAVAPGSRRCGHGGCYHKYVHTSVSAAGLLLLNLLHRPLQHYGQHTEPEPVAQPHPKDTSQDRRQDSRRALAARPFEGLERPVWFCQLIRNCVERGTR